MTPTATQTSYQEQRMPSIKPTAYTAGFNDGREGSVYENPYRHDQPQWLTYDMAHFHGRKAAAELEAARGGGR